MLTGLGFPDRRSNTKGLDMQDRLLRVSKYLSKYLRHAPHELGLSLHPGGWVSVDDLLDAARRHNFPIE